MDVGLLWCDTRRKRALEEKVDAAVAAYLAKPRFEGQVPNVCYVHRGMLPDDKEVRLDGVRIVPATSIPPFHLLVGVEENGRGSE